MQHLLSCAQAAVTNFTDGLRINDIFPGRNRDIDRHIIGLDIIGGTACGTADSTPARKLAGRSGIGRSGFEQVRKNGSARLAVSFTEGAHGVCRNDK